MKINQRDIINIEFLFPNGKTKNHYGIVVSNNELIEAEGFVYLVLITSKDYNSEYYFELSDDMILNFKFPKKSYAKCHILMVTVDNILSQRVGTIKNSHLSK
ncbi:hypothetical protein FACS189440_20530 [Bacteroidia bacterium]|nr:hypothetical protein FACS189440_20530 [Bacteroidia bacterium]